MSEQKPAKADTFGPDPVEPQWQKMVREHPWIVDRLLVHGITEENFGNYETESAFPGHGIVQVYVLEPFPMLEQGGWPDPKKRRLLSTPSIILMTDKTFGDRDFTYAERQAWRAGHVAALKRDAVAAYGLHGYYSVPLEKPEKVSAPTSLMDVIRAFVDWMKVRATLYWLKVRT